MLKIESGSRRSTILLAEDSHDDEALFKLAMRKSHLTNPVVVVRGGDDAIAYLKGEGAFADREKFPFPGLLFIDLKMPRVSGLEVLEWIHGRPQLGERFLKVVLTNFGDTTKITRAYELGANSFLSKPITEQDFQNLVDHFQPFWASPAASDPLVSSKG